MAKPVNKVLIVACLEDSRPAAYDISIEIKKHGYTTDFGHVKPEDEEDKKEQESKVKPDLYLTKHMDLDIYDGVVFLDDGGDSDVAKVLAKRANESDLAIGGYGHGGVVLHEANLPEDKLIPV